MLAQSLANVIERADEELTLFQHIVKAQPHHSVCLVLAQIRDR